MKLIIILVIVLFLTSYAYGKKIIERFGGSYPKDSCRVLYPSFVDGIEGDFKQRCHPLIDSISKGFAFMGYLNCTMVPWMGDQDPLEMLPNGTYTSAIGFIQQNEADILTLVVRPDSLPNEPGIIGPELLEADIAILSARLQGNAERNVRQLTVFFADFPVVNYAFILIMTFIFMVMYLIMEHRDMPLIERISIKKLLNLTEGVSQAFMDSVNLDASRTTGRIVLGSFLIFLFLLLYGIFLSKIGADMVTLKEPHELERIEELLQNDDVTTTTIKQMWFLRLLDAELKYRPESVMAEVTRYVYSNPKGIFDVSTLLDNPETAMEANVKLLKGLFTNKVAILQETMIIKYYQKVNCVINSAIASMVRTSKATYAPGTLNFIYSHMIDPKVRRVMDYYLRVQREGSLIDTYIETTKEVLLDFYSLEQNRYTLQCELGMNETLAEMRLGFGSFRQITTYDYEAAFVAMGYALAFSFVVLVGEILHKQLSTMLVQHKSRVSKMPRVRQEIVEDTTPNGKPETSTVTTKDMPSFQGHERRRHAKKIVLNIPSTTIEEILSEISNFPRDETTVIKTTRRERLATLPLTTNCKGYQNA